MKSGGEEVDEDPAGAVDKDASVPAPPTPILEGGWQAVPRRILQPDNELLDEDGSWNRSATELGGDSPTPVPSKAIEKVDEDGSHNRSVTELGGDSPTPVPSKVVEEKEEAGSQRSATALGSDSPTPIPSVPPDLHLWPIASLPSGGIHDSRTRSAIEDSVDELGVHSQSASGMGGDSPAPVPST